MLELNPENEPFIDKSKSLKEYFIVCEALRKMHVSANENIRSTVGEKGGRDAYFESKADEDPQVPEAEEALELAEEFDVEELRYARNCADQMVDVF